MVKIRTETEMSLTLWPGDTFTVCEDRVDENGEIKRNVFVTDEIKKDMVINKIVTFDVEKGDFGDNVVEEVEGGLPLAYNYYDGAACVHAVFGTSTEETLPKREDRAQNKSETLLQIFKHIARTYTPEEINEATQLLQDEVTELEGRIHSRILEGNHM